MRYDSNRAQYEASLARAHRNLFIAQQRAYEMGDAGASDDCLQLLREVTRLSEDSLAPHRKRRQIQGQLRIQS